MRVVILKSVLLFAIAIATPVLAGEETHDLPPAEERAWIDTAENLKTADGATVMQVLEYAQTMRSSAFKIGPAQMGYDNNGKPAGVIIGYWIGQKRLPDDMYVLGFDVHKKPTGGLYAESTDKETDIRPGRPEPQIMKGRDAFLSWVDETYEMNCVDPESGKKSC